MASIRSLILHSLQIRGAFCLGAQISKIGWKINATDSQAGYPIQNVIDGNPNTLWQSSYSPLVPPPHVVNLDMGAIHLVDGISVLPRQDGSDKGNIAQHIVTLSSDGQNWSPPVALGTWNDEIQLKETSFVARPARYIRLTALTEVNGNPWASMAEFNVHQEPDPFISQNGWTVSASSQETIAENDPATNVLDTIPYTYWHSRYSGIPEQFPHTLTINIGSSVPVSGLLYVPRQAIGTGGSQNGRIGQYRIETSVNGFVWKQVASGNWSDDDTNKAGMWPTANARYVRLTGLSEAGNRGPWSSAGDIRLMSGSALANYQAPNPLLGLWSHTVELPLVPAAIASIPNANQILAWSAYSLDDYIYQNQGKTQTTIWDVASNAISTLEVANTQHDMFCPGVSTDTTGRFVITGGNDANRTTIYNPFTKQWLRGANMNVGRGYQSQTTLSDGRIFTIGGSWSGEDTIPKNGEVYNVNTDTWTNLTGCLVTPIMTNDTQGQYRADNHQWMFAWSNATIFHAGPSQTMAWFSTSGNGSITTVGKRASDSDSMNGVAVLYDALAGKIFTAGGAPDYQGAYSHPRTHLITLNGINQVPSVQRVADMSFSRGFHTAVALPDGTIFVVGGQAYVAPFTDIYASYNPEIFNPVTQTYTVMNSHASARNYHSTSLLLPDGSIFSAGGGLCGGCATNHYDGELFLPPYLLNADGTPRQRPNITNVSGSTFALGSTIQIKTNASVVSAALMRLGTATHTVNTDQRRLPYKVSGTSFSITIPTDPGVALPGFYYLFVLDSNGTPSIAQTIQITNTPQHAPVSNYAVPHLEVLHTNSEPDPKSSVNSYLGVPAFDALLGNTARRVRRFFRA